jgi:hypothetical protein
MSHYKNSIESAKNRIRQSDVVQTLVAAGSVAAGVYAASEPDASNLGKGFVAMLTFSAAGSIDARRTQKAISEAHYSTPDATIKQAAGRTAMNALVDANLFIAGAVAPLLLSDSPQSRQLGVGFTAFGVCVLTTKAVFQQGLRGPVDHAERYEAEGDILRSEEPQQTI